MRDHEINGKTFLNVLLRGILVFQVSEALNKHKFLRQQFVGPKKLYSSFSALVHTNENCNPFKYSKLNSFSTY